MFYKLNLRCKKKKFDKKKDISTSQSLEYNLPLVNAKNGDNGVMYYGRLSDWESADYCIDIVNDGAVSTGNVYPQPQETGVLYNAYLIKGKDVSFHNEFVIIYIAQALQKSIKLKYGYDNKATWEKVKNNTLVLPSINDLPCTKFMESYIRELEQERIRELDAYLRATGHNNYELTPEEEKCIQFMHSSRGIKYKEFKIGDLFYVHSSMKKFNANSVKFGGKYPYVARGASNNGIRGYITENTKYLNKGNTLSVGQDTGTVYYQKEPYFTGDKIKVAELKEQKLTEKTAIYFIVSIRKKFSEFKWGQNSFSESTLLELPLLLPITSEGYVNYQLMENYIKGVEKICIRSVVEWKERVIETTKTMVNQIP